MADFHVPCRSRHDTSQQADHPATLLFYVRVATAFLVTRFDRHIFVCTNRRPAGGRPACGPRGGEALRLALERAIAGNPELSGRVAVTACACLGPCFDGPNLVVYPEGVWYAGASPADAAAIVSEHLLGNRPVERLRYAWPDDD